MASIPIAALVVDMHGQRFKEHHAGQLLHMGCCWKVEHMESDSWVGKDSVQRSRIVPLNHFHF